MLYFKYKVRDKDNNLIKDVIQANSKKQAISKLKEKGYYIIQINVTLYSLIKNSFKRKKEKNTDKTNNNDEVDINKTDNNNNQKNQLNYNNDTEGVVEGISSNETTQQDQIEQNVLEKLKNIDENKLKKKNNKQARLDFSILNREDTEKIKIDKKLLREMSNNLSVMLKSGVNIRKCIQILINKTSYSKLKKILQGILQDLDAGKSLSQSMSKYPKTFSRFYIAIVDIGEQTGRLSENFKNIVTYLDIIIDIENKINKATLYPKLAFSFIGILLIILSQFVIPNFVDFIPDEEGLPLLSEIVFLLSDYMIFIIPFILLLILVFKLISKFDFIQKLIDKILVKLPIIREITLSIAMFFFSFTLSKNIESGLNIVQSLELSSDTVQNTEVRNEIKQSIEDLKKGKELSESFSGKKYIDEIIIVTLIAGEESGELEQVLENVSSAFKENVDEKTNKINTLVPFISVLIIMSIVLPTVVGIYLPMIDVMTGGF